jgi:hypothetical protein
MAPSLTELFLRACHSLERHERQYFSEMHELLWLWLSRVPAAMSGFPLPHSLISLICLAHIPAPSYTLPRHHVPALSYRHDRLPRSLSVPVVSYTHHAVCLGICHSQHTACIARCVRCLSYTHHAARLARHYTFLFLNTSRGSVRNLSCLSHSLPRSLIHVLSYTPHAACLEAASTFPSLIHITQPVSALVFYAGCLGSLSPALSFYTHPACLDPFF